MPCNPLPVWFLFAALAYLGRRDRRLLARWPLTGLIASSLLLAAYLGWRIRLHPGPLTERDALVLHAVLVLAGGFALPALVAWSRAFIRGDLARAALWLRREARWVLTCGLLAASAAAVYFLFGTWLAAHGAFQRDTTVYGSDPSRCSRIMAGTARDFDYTTHKHPLFPLIGRALFVAAAPCVGPSWAPLAVSSAAGGLCVALAGVYFRSITGSRLQGALAALLLGSTSAYVLLAAVPETCTLSAAALILLHVLLAGRRSAALRVRHQVLAAAFAGGMTLLNAVPALVCFAGRHPGQRRIRVVLRWIASTAVVGSLLVAVQDWLIPLSTPGLARESSASELSFVSVPARPWTALAGVGRALLVEGVVGATPRIAPDMGQPVLHVGRYETKLALSATGLWLLLVLAALAVLIRARGDCRPTFWAAGVCLGVAALLHTFYGRREIFLYSCTYTFCLMGVLAHALPRVNYRAAVAILAVSVGALAVCNTLYGAQVLAALDQVRAARG